MPNLSNINHNSGLLFLRRYVVKYKLRFLGVLASLLIITCSLLSLGLALKRVVDIDGARSLNSAVFMLMGVVVVFATFSAIRVYLIESTSEKIASDIKQDIYSKIIRFNSSYFTSVKISDLTSRLVDDSAVIRNVINTIFSFLIRNTMIMLGGIGLLLKISPSMSLYFLLVVPLMFLPIIFLAKKLKCISKKSQAESTKISAHTEETMSYIKSVQAYNREEYEENKLSSILRGSTQVILTRVKYKSLLVGCSIFSMALAVFSIVWLGGSKMIGSNLSGADLVSFMFYTLIVSFAIAGMSEIMADIRRASGSADRIVELLRVNVETTNGKELVLPTNYAIEFNNVSFSYPSREVVILKDLSFRIKSGQKLLLRGKSGNGKTTICQLLLKFYTPTSGSIKIADIDINELNTHSLREKIAYVSQDVFIFSDSIYNNIAYGKLDATKDEIINASKLSGVHNFIESLPNGYSTYVGEKGVELSGGQKQRISIARAILKSPEVLILDEAMSNLDRNSEEEIYIALDKVMKNKVQIVISHRNAIVFQNQKLCSLG